MTRRRWFAALAILAAMAGVFALRGYRHRHARDPTSAATTQAASMGAGVQPVSALPGPKLQPVTAADIASDPAVAARHWAEAGHHVIESKDARLFGVDAARLRQLPPAQAWHALKARAGDGDAGAAKAALALANDCSTLALRVSSNAPTHGNYVDRLLEGLPDDWSGLLRAIDADQQDRQAGRVTDCEGVGGTMDFALQVIDRFMRPDDSQTQLEAALDNEDDSQAISDLRQLADELHDDPSRLALAERLIKSRNAVEQVEGRAMLEQMASTGNADATVLLASCLYRDCGFFVRDRAAAAPWIEQAAGLGEWSSLNAQIDDLESAGRPVDAFAWALYRLELAQSGCFEFGELQLTYLAVAARAVFNPKNALTATQQVQAHHLLAAINPRWRAKADAYLGCAG